MIYLHIDVDLLTRISVSSPVTGEVLGDWKMAKFVPLFKKESRENPGNCRPVIHRSVVGKLLNRILKDSI